MAGPKVQNQRKKSAKGNAAKGSTSEAWTCLECEDAPDDRESIECHNCKNWCHRKCTELTNQQYDSLKTGGDFIVWRCKRCREEGAKLERPRLEAKIDKMSKIMETLVQRLEKVEEHNRDLMEEMEKRLETKVEEKVSEYMEEQKEKEKRKLNIIVSNIKESKKETAENRMEEDKNEFLSHVRQELEIEGSEIEEIIRLGKQQETGRPRLMRVKLKSGETKGKIMKQAITLNKKKKPEERIYINNDMTPKERVKNKELREEKKRREQDGERDLMIKNGQIVKRSVGAAVTQQAAATKVTN